MAQLDVLIGHLSQQAQTRALTDRELLEGFLGSRDERCFELLVVRYQALVFGVCWRMLRHRQDAEDAFQAVFLVLAQKARSIRKQQSLASWLHGVSSRVARKALSKRSRLPIQPCQSLDHHAAPAASHLSFDVREAIDQAIQTLPAIYREAVILCDLEGCSREEAAQRLGWNEGTLSGRLHRARQLLARRLERYGIGVETANPQAAERQTLSTEEIRTTVAQALSAPAAGSALSSALAREVLRDMFWHKVKWLVCTVFVGAFVLAAFHVIAGPPKESPSPEPPEPPLVYADHLEFGALPAGAIGRLGALDFRHGSDPAVAFSRDGKTYYTGGRVNEIYAWDVKTRKLLRRFQLPPISGAIAKLHCLANGTLVVLALDGFVLYVDGETGKIIRTIRSDPPDNTLLCMDVSSDGTRLAIGDQQGKIRLLDIATGKTLPFAAAHPRKAGDATFGWVHHVAFSQDGKQILSAGHKDRQRLWDVKTGKEITSFDPNDFAGGETVFSPDGKLVAISRYISPDSAPNGRAATTLWQLNPLRPSPVKLQDALRATALTFNQDGRLLVLGGYSLGVWDTRTGKRRFDQRLPTFSSRMALSPDEKHVVYQGRWWNIETGKERFIDAGHVGSICALALSPNGRMAATGADDGTVRVWDVQTSKQQWYRTLADDVPTPVSLTFSPLGDQLAVLALDEVVYILDARSGKELRRTQKITAQPTQVHWSPDGKYLVAGGGNYTLFIFDAETAKFQKKLIGFDGGMNTTWCFAFSPDSKSIAAPVCYQGTDRIDKTGLKRVNILLPRKQPGPNDYDSALGPPHDADGKTYLALWDVASGKRIGLVGPGADEGPLGLAFSPDGATLAVQDRKGVRLHDVKTGKVVRHIQVDSWPITYFGQDRLVVGNKAYFPLNGRKRSEFPVRPWVSAVSADGKRLITAGYQDCTPLVWSLAK